MKKYELINQYLEKVRAKDEEILLNMKWQDLVTVPELKGINGRTIFNILKEFKSKHGLMSEQIPLTPKKTIVWNYLSGLYDDLGDQFYKIRGRDLLGVPELSSIGKTSILTAVAKFKRAHPPKKKSNKKSVQPKVTETSFDTLQAKFPDIKKKSVQQQVSEYLDKNTEASFDTLKSAFPDINPNSLSAYKSVWKKELESDKQDKQKKPTAKQAKPATKKKQLDKIAKPGKPKQTVKSVKKKDKPVKETKPDKPAKKDNTELIQSLKKTIAAQEKTIQTMNRSIELLGQESDVEELKGMTLSEIKSVAVTYLKSIKELPAKIRK